jgi:hypothetical protein
MLRAARGDVRVGPGLTTGLAVLRTPALGGDDPIVEAFPALPEWVLGGLVWPGDEAVERD